MSKRYRIVRYTVDISGHSSDGAKLKMGMAEAFGRGMTPHYAVRFAEDGSVAADSLNREGAPIFEGDGEAMAALRRIEATGDRGRWGFEDLDSVRE